MSLTPLHTLWLEHLQARAGALNLVLLLAGLIVLWLVYARWLWPRLLPALRLFLVALYLVSLVFSGVYRVCRPASSAARFDPLATLGWQDPAAWLDLPAGPGTAPLPPRR